MADIFELQSWLNPSRPNKKQKYTAIVRKYQPYYNNLTLSLILFVHIYYYLSLLSRLRPLGLNLVFLFTKKYFAIRFK